MTTSPSLSMRRPPKRSSWTRLLVLGNLFVAFLGVYEATRFAAAYNAAVDAGNRYAHYPRPGTISWAMTSPAPPTIAVGEQQAADMAAEVEDLATAKQRFDKARLPADTAPDQYVRGLIQAMRSGELDASDRESCLQELAAISPDSKVVGELYSLLLELIDKPDELPLPLIQSVARVWDADPNSTLRQKLDYTIRNAEAQVRYKSDATATEYYANQFVTLNLTPFVMLRATSEKPAPIDADLAVNIDGSNAKSASEVTVSQVLTELKSPHLMQGGMSKVLSWKADDPRRNELLALMIEHTRLPIAPSPAATNRWIDQAAIGWRDRSLFNALLAQAALSQTDELDTELVWRQIQLALADGDPRWVTTMLQSLPSQPLDASLRARYERPTADDWAFRMVMAINYLTTSQPDWIEPWLNQNTLAGAVARRALIVRPDWSPLVIQRLRSWLGETVAQDADGSQWRWLESARVDATTAAALTDVVESLPDTEQQSRAWRWWLPIVSATRNDELATTAVTQCQSTVARRQAILKLLSDSPTADWALLRQVVAQRKQSAEQAVVDAEGVKVARQIDAKLATMLIQQKLPPGADAMEILQQLGGPVTAIALDSKQVRAAVSALQWPAGKLDEIIHTLTLRGDDARY